MFGIINGKTTVQVNIRPRTKVWEIVGPPKENLLKNKCAVLSTLHLKYSTAVCNWLGGLFLLIGMCFYFRFYLTSLVPRLILVPNLFIHAPPSCEARALQKKLLIIFPDRSGSFLYFTKLYTTNVWRDNATDFDIVELWTKITRMISSLKFQGNACLQCNNCAMFWQLITVSGNSLYGFYVAFSPLFSKYQIAGLAQSLCSLLPLVGIL